MREKIYVVLHQATAMIGMLLVLKFLTNYLDVEQFGLYSLVLSVMALISILPFNSVSQANIRYFSIYQNKNKYPEFIFVVVKWFLIFCTIYIFIFIVSNSVLKYDWLFVSLIYFLAMTEVAKTSMRGLVNSARQRKKVFFSAILEFTIKIVSIFVINKFYNLELYWVLGIFIIGNVVSVIPLLSKIFNGINRVRKKTLKTIEIRIFWFALPLLTWGGFGWARDMSNRWYLEWYVDTDSVAIFTVLTSVTLILPTAIQSLVNSYYIPILYQKENKEPGYTSKFMNKFAIFYIGIIIILTFLVSFLSEHVVIFFSSERYVSYAFMLPYLLLIYSSYVLFSIMAIEVFSAKKTAYLLVPNLLPGFISIVLGYLLIKKYGLNGAFYNYIITYTVYSFLMFLAIINFRRKRHKL